MSGKIFSGIFCLPVTPLKNGDEEIDEDILRTITDVIIEDGVTGARAAGDKAIILTHPQHWHLF